MELRSSHHQPGATLSRASRTSRPDGKHTRNDGRSKTWTRSARPPQIAHVILFDSLYKTQGTPVVPFRFFLTSGFPYKS